MKSALGRKLMVTTAAGVLGTLVVATQATAQGQDDQGRGIPQAGDDIQAGGNMQGGADVRGGSRTDTRARVGAGQRSNIRGNNGNANVRARGDVRTRRTADTRRRVSADTRRTVFRNDVEGGQRYETWRDTRWRDRGYYGYGGGPSFSVGFGYSDPYYSYGYSEPSYAYGYSDPYYSYGYAQPYRYGGYSGGYNSYAASPGCTCGSAPYASWGASSWDRGGRW
jgi:hypothetical protein